MFLEEILEEAPNKLKMRRLYHGTSDGSAKEIDREGFKDKKDKVTNQLLGDGVYTTPDIGMARHYAKDRARKRGEKPAVIEFLRSKDKATTRDGVKTIGRKDRDNVKGLEAKDKSEKRLTSKHFLKKYKREMKDDARKDKNLKKALKKGEEAYPQRDNIYQVRAHKMDAEEANRRKVKKQPIIRR
jgi:hypothetical protein